jgi:hypothetical protein
VFDQSNSGSGVDRLTLQYAMQKVADTHIRHGEKEAGRKVLKELKGFLAKQNLPKHELNRANERIDSAENAKTAAVSSY